jgi:glucose dehydrogenase
VVVLAIARLIDYSGGFMTRVRRFADAGRSSLPSQFTTATLRLGTNGQDRKSWREYGGGPDNSHCLELTLITKANVDQRELAWTYPTNDNILYVFNPVIVDHVMYVLARSNALVALDATTGKEIWVHDNLQGIVERGINYWESKDRRARRLLFQRLGSGSGRAYVAFALKN